MISLLVSFFIGLVILLFESTALHALSLHHVMPNLTLILIVSFSVVQGKEKGRILGLLLGLLQDLLFCPVMGFYGFLFFLIGHFSGRMTEEMTELGLMIPLGIVAGFDALYGLISYGIFGFLRGDIHFGYYLVNRILPEVFYTTVVALLLVPIAKAVWFRLMERDARVREKGRSIR